MVDDMGIMPYDEISDVKRGLNSMKKGSSPDVSAKMDALTSSLNNMITIFKNAAEEMKLEERDDKILSDKIQPMFDKIDEMLEQNRTIAEGLVAVADMVKSLKGEVSRIKTVRPEVHHEIPVHHAPPRPPSTPNLDTSVPDFGAMRTPRPTMPPTRPGPTPPLTGMDEPTMPSMRHDEPTMRPPMPDLSSDPMGNGAPTMPLPPGNEPPHKPLHPGYAAPPPRFIPNPPNDPDKKKSPEEWKI